MNTILLLLIQAALIALGIYYVLQDSLFIQWCGIFVLIVSSSGLTLNIYTLMLKYKQDKEE